MLYPHGGVESNPSNPCRQKEAISYETTIGPRRANLPFAQEVLLRDSSQQQHSVRMSKVEQAWETQQKTTFLKWLNNKLKKAPDAPKINSVADLADGIALCMLLSIEFPQAQMPK